MDISFLHFSVQKNVFFITIEFTIQTFAWLVMRYVLTVSAVLRYDFDLAIFHNVFIETMPLSKSRIIFVCACSI